MSVYDLRAMNNDEVLDVIAVNGLTLRLNASVRYRLEPSEVIAVQEEMGLTIMKRSSTRSCACKSRRVIGRYTRDLFHQARA